MTPEQRMAGINLLLNLSGYVDSRVCPSSWHSFQVARLVKSIATKLDYLPRDTISIYWAALLHDVGKVGVPEKILTKPGPLSADEWAVMKLHPVIGANIVDSFAVTSHISPMIHFHQERYDGSGYPDGLQGEEIPLGARILAVVDAYEAMTSDRVYRKALRPQKAIAEIRSGSGRYFDPRVTEAFLSIL